jgi:hypothetical protein
MKDLGFSNRGYRLKISRSVILNESLRFLEKIPGIYLS